MLLLILIIVIFLYVYCRAQITNITNYVCGEKIVMWRNFGEILGNFEKFWEILGDFATIYALSCGEKLGPKSTFVKKK